MTDNIKTNINQCYDTIDNDPKFDNTSKFSIGNKDLLPIVTVRL